MPTSVHEFKPMLARDRFYLKQRYALKLTRHHPEETFQAYQDDVIRRCKRRDRMATRRYAKPGTQE